VPSSRRYRSANDFENKDAKQLLLTDTPGHAKLRHYAYDRLNALCALHKKGSGTSGVIFVVDAANVSASDGGAAALRDAAGYLHDVLMTLQRAYVGAKSSKYTSVPVLVAANKLDLFTALPAPLVKATLEAEITRLRATRSKGIAAVGKAGKGEGLDATLDDDEGAGDGEAEVLGGGDPESKFAFEQMDEWGVDVIVIGGNVAGDEGPGVEGWWEWIAGLL
jgi:signal recognition particle receptor subunit beta